ncbi:hypothetical protein BHE74_00032583 [Ensete ventricosum]|uniref:Cation-transporting P-type ATPase C-terminal domain-containing protein n=1 Tax=Ensete ventricosum TaxID=4639 RepID=A0A445MIX2_ENSVE|nr:hypothetical protein BHE74_00032583 [Ensete ventricosum]RZR74217.1 hypothetical protein BHM03_00033903 [Ensete ventricosum]
MAIALANGGGKPPDWEDFVGIVILLVINSTISFIEENNAGNAAAALMARLAPKTKIMNLCNCKEDVRKRVHTVIDKFAERGLRSLAVARQEVPERSKESHGGAWQFVGLLPLFDPPRHDSAETIRKALNLGVNVKMITGASFPRFVPAACAPNHYLMISVAVSSCGWMYSFLGTEHKYEIVRKLQERKHICGMTGDGVNDAPALKKADIGIAVSDATDAARSASDIVLTEPGLSVIISAVLTSRAIFQRMKNYTRPRDDGGSVPASQHHQPGPHLRHPLSQLVLPRAPGTPAVRCLCDSSTGTSPPVPSEQVLRGDQESFVLNHQVATLIAVYADWGFAKIKGCGWGWAGIIWLYSFITFVPLDWIKFAIRYILSGKAWDSLFERKVEPHPSPTAFTTKKDYGREEREAQWATAQRTLHGLQPPETTNLFSDKSSYREFSEIAEQAKRRAGIAR